MKKVYSLLIIALSSFCLNSSAQSFPPNTCATAYGVTTSLMYGGSATTGVPNTDLSNDYGCISPANNAMWFYFQACVSGTMTAEVHSTFGSADDVDFIAWGPLTSPTDCGLTAGQILDCSNAVGYLDTMSFPVIAGSYYKFLISNPSNTPGGFFIQAMGSSPLFSDSCYACMTAVIPIQEICQVTTDPVANRNVIIWEKDTTYTGDYLIQKETTTMGVFMTLDTVLNNDTSAYMDNISNPSIQSFQYRIATSDTCGHLNVTGTPHQTIHLLTSVSSSTGYPQLSWNPYWGFSYGTYYIYRGASAATVSLYDSISASFNTYTDVAAMPGMNYYSVAVFPPAACQPSHMMIQPCMSNTSPVMFTGIDELVFNALTVGPNPAKDEVLFSLGTITNVTVDVVDITGRIVLSSTFENTSQGAIPLGEITNGSYVLRFASEDRTSFRKIVIAK